MHDRNTGKLNLDWIHLASLVEVVCVSLATLLWEQYIIWEKSGSGDIQLIPQVSYHSLGIQGIVSYYTYWIVSFVIILLHLVLKTPPSFCYMETGSLKYMWHSNTHNKLWVCHFVAILAHVLQENHPKKVLTVEPDTPTHSVHTCLNSNKFH